MDIKLGKIVLTKNQIQHLLYLKVGNVKGFAYWHDTQTVIAVVTRDLTAEEKSSLIAQIQVLPDTVPYSVIEALFSYAVLLPSLLVKFAGAKAFQLAPYLAAIQGYCGAKNFTGLRDFAFGMVQAGLMTTEDYNLFNTAIKEQSIDLDNLPE